jgi:hypothetical protein
VLYAEQNIKKWSQRKRMTLTPEQKRENFDVKKRGKEKGE